VPVTSSFTTTYSLHDRTRRTKTALVREEHDAAFETLLIPGITVLASGGFHASAVVSPWRSRLPGGRKVLKVLKVLKMRRAGGMSAFPDITRPRPRHAAVARAA